MEKLPLHAHASHHCSRDITIVCHPCFGPLLDLSPKGVLDTLERVLLQAEIVHLSKSISWLRRFLDAFKNFCTLKK